MGFIKKNKTKQTLYSSRIDAASVPCHLCTENWMKHSWSFSSLLRSEQRSVTVKLGSFRSLDWLSDVSRQRALAHCCPKIGHRSAGCTALLWSIGGPTKLWLYLNAAYQLRTVIGACGFDWHFFIFAWTSALYKDQTHHTDIFSNYFQRSRISTINTRYTILLNMYILIIIRLSMFVADLTRRNKHKKKLNIAGESITAAVVDNRCLYCLFFCHLAASIYRL